MTTALEGGEWWAARPGRTLPLGKTRYPFYRRLGGPQGRSGRAENLVPTGIRSRTVQPVVSRYSDWATRPTGFIFCRLEIHRQPLVKTVTNLSLYQEAGNSFQRLLVFLFHGARFCGIKNLGLATWKGVRELRNWVCQSVGQQCILKGTDVTFRWPCIVINSYNKTN